MVAIDRAPIAPLEADRWHAIDVIADPLGERIGEAIGAPIGRVWFGLRLIVPPVVCCAIHLSLWAVARSVFIGVKFARSIARSIAGR